MKYIPLIYKRYVLIKPKPSENIKNGLIVELKETPFATSTNTAYTDIIKGRSRYYFDPNMIGIVINAFIRQ